MMKSKSAGVILILALGSLGVFYSSIKWGLIMTFVAPIIEIVLIIISLYFVPGGIIFSALLLAIVHIIVCISVSNRAIDRYNSKVK